MLRKILVSCARSGSHRSSRATGNSVAALIKAVNSSSTSSFASGGLSSIKANMLPFFPAADASASGLSMNAQIALGLGAAYICYKAGVHASSPDWIVDLSLDVIQSAWWISFLSFLPFRSIYVSLRGMAPHSASALVALRPAVLMKP